MNFPHRGNTAAYFAGQKLLELADIVHVSQFVSFESDSECLLDAEHQIDMRYGVPAFDIGGYHLIAQYELIIVEYLTKYFFQSIVQIHELPHIMRLGVVS
ncbi:MAG: hypothetical protein LZF62_290002 [Nitrospira sp.]|nr:MAG: hypothetical protein LZF62_290002 [Nitrospira sp.]